MRSRPLIAIGLLALLLTAPACSSESNGSNPSANGGGGGNSGSLPECLTSAAVSAALGISFGDLVQTNGTKDRNCNYAPTSVETGLAALSFQLMAGAGDFAGVKAGYSTGRTVTSIEGLGDEAFASVLSAGPSPKNTVATRKGLLLILVSSYAPVDKEKAFIATLLG